MGKDMTMNEFMKDVDAKGKSDILDLKTAGKLQVFLHPSSGIRRRNSHWFPVFQEVEEEVTKKGKKTKVKKWKVKNMMFVCPNTKKDYTKCPVCSLRKMLRDNDDIDMDDIVIEVGEGNELEQYTKGDIIGEEGYDWKKNLAYKKEYLFGAIDVEESEKVEVLIAPHSLGKDIKKVIKEEQEDEGVEDGDPFMNPYAFKLIYDADEVPAKMYSASKGKAKLTDEIEELLDGDGVDLDALSDPADPKDIFKMLKETLVHEDIDIDDLKPSNDDDDEEDEEEEKTSKKNNKDKKNDKTKDKKKNKKDEEEDDEEEEKTSKKNKKNDKAKDKKKNKKDDEEDTDDDEEDEEEEKKPAKKNKKEEKGGKKKNDKDNMDECPNCGKKVKKNAKKCPYCKAEFDDEETIECPECGKECSLDADECPHCGADMLPF